MSDSGPNAEQVLSALFQSTTRCLIAVDRTGRVVRASRGAGTLLKTSMKGATLARWRTGARFETLDGRQMERDELPLTRALRGEATCWRGRMSGADGVWRTLAVDARPILDDDGAVIGAVALIDDVEAEERHEETRFFLDSIVENIPTMVFIKDADLRFVRWNRAGAELVGYSSEEMLGKTDYDFFPADQADFFTAADRAALTGGALVDIPEEWVETRDKGPRLLHTRKIPIHDSEGRPAWLLGISQDITERHRARQQLAAHALELERSNRELSRFAWLASHDLKEPLRMVASFTQLLARQYGDQLDERAHQWMRFAIEGAERMSTLVEGLLAHSRVQNRPLPFAAVDLEKTLRAARANLRVALEKSEGRIDSQPLPTVAGDASQLLQLLQNLLGNAIKFAGAGPPRIEIEARAEGALWHLLVRDRGIGVPEADQERVFEIFRRGHTEQRFPGSGIGLALCRAIVERHRGTIELVSAEGGGTEVRFTLPAWEEPAAEQPATGKPAAEKPAAERLAAEKPAG